MSWLWGKSKDTGLPPPTALHNQRSRQIEALKSLNQNVIELQRDVEYRVNTTAYGSTISLHINLPPSFPQEPPVVKVSPPVNHPWVNEHMLVTGCQQLNMFTIHNDLGRVIRTIVDEFQVSPPSIKANYPATTGYQYAPPLSLPTCPQFGPPNSLPTCPQYAPSTNPPLYSPATPTLTPTHHLPETPLEERLRSVPAPPPYSLPELPTSFPELDKLSKKELESLVKDDEKLEALVSQRAELATIQEDLKQMRLNNENRAKDNLSRQPIMEKKKQKLLDSFDVMTSLRQDFETRSVTCDGLRSRYQPSTIHARLQIGAAQAEQASDGIAEKFIEGQLDVDDFMKQFIDTRKLWYRRKAKEERYSQSDHGWR